MGFIARLKNTLGHSTVNQDTADELAWHLEQRTQEYVDRGLSFTEARAAAQQRLGSYALLRETTTQSDLIVWLETLRRDVSLALRMLRRAPTVTAVAVLSLALGIGANTVVFTLMKQVVLDYLPVPAPEQLLILHSQGVEEGHTSGTGIESSFSYPLYRDLNGATSRIFDGIVAFHGIDVSLAGHDATETVHGYLVSGNFFRVLQVAPWRGRMITPSEDQAPGANPVAVLSYGLWMRAFGGDSSIVNRTVLLNRRPYVVVGIAPPQFYGINVSSRADLFVPMSMKDEVYPNEYPLNDRLDHWCSLIARLKPGVSAERATAALSVIYPPLRDQDLTYMKSPSAEFRQKFALKRIETSAGGKGYASLRDQLSNPLKILMGMVAIVLLITVVNVANLLVARSVARQREMAIRLSVGAGKVALIRQLMIESLVLAFLGGGLGVLVAYGCAPPLFHLLSFDLSAASISARPDWQVLLLAGGVTLIAGVAFGLLPALQSARADLASALKSEGNLGNSGHSAWLRRGLVVGQVALSLVLVMAAFLFTRSLQTLKNINVGFNTAQLVKFKLNPLQAGYTQQRIQSFGEELRQKLIALPGVESASIATVPVLEETDQGGDISAEGAPETSSQDDSRDAYHRNFVSPGFFSTMQIPIVAGRQFTAADSLPSSKVAVVNQTFAQHFFPGKNPIGMHFAYGSGHKPLDQTVIGVVADSKHTSIQSQIIPFVYAPYLTNNHLSELVCYVRVHSNERAVMPGIRSVVRRLDASLPVNELSSLTETIDESLFAERSLSFLSVGFAALATLLAIVGLYGIMSYSVTRRYRELGIRMSVGATPSRVLIMVLKESAFLGVAGVVCGLPCVFATARYVRSSLHGVQPESPAVYLSAAALLVAIALMAGFIPARNAARIDPHTALRTE